MKKKSSIKKEGIMREAVEEIIGSFIAKYDKLIDMKSKTERLEDLEEERSYLDDDIDSGMNNVREGLDLINIGLDFISKTLEEINKLDKDIETENIKLGKDKKKRICKYEGCSYYDKTAKTYCCNACSADAYVTKRLNKKKEEENKNGR